MRQTKVGGINISHDVNENNMNYMSSLIQCLKSRGNGLLEIQGNDMTQLHLNILSQYIKESEEYKQPNPRQIFFFCRSYQVLQNIEFSQIVKIIPKRQILCVNSSVNTGLQGIDERCNLVTVGSSEEIKCSYYKKFYQGQKIEQQKQFNDIEDYKHLLRQSHICPFFYEKQKFQQDNQRQLILGTHNDLFDNMAYNDQEKLNFENSLIFIDDCQNITQKLEINMSFTLNDEMLNQLCLSLLGFNRNKKQLFNEWEKKIEKICQQPQEQQINNSAPQIICINQIELVTPIIGLLSRIHQHFIDDSKFMPLQDGTSQNQHYRVFQASEAYNLISKLTENSFITDFEKFCKKQGINYQFKDKKDIVYIKNLRFQEGLHSENIYQYIEIFITYLKSLQESSDLQQFSGQWINFLRKACSLTNNDVKSSFNLTETDNNFLQTIFQSQLESKSLNGSFQETNSNLDEDYKLIVIRKNQNYVFKLNCGNPKVGMNKLINIGVKNVIISGPTLFPMKLFDSEIGLIFDHKYSYNQLLGQSNLKLQVCCLENGQNGQKYQFQKLNQNSLQAQRNITDNLFNPQVELMPNNLIITQSILTNFYNFLLKEHAFLILFTSKSLMNNCQQLWNKEEILNDLSRQRSLNWIDSSNKLVIYEGVKLFLNRSQNYLSDQIQIPSLYAKITPLFINLLKDAIIMMNRAKNKSHMIFQQKLPITCVLIGVPWANSSMYDDEILKNFTNNTIQFEQKLKWLKNLNQKYDCKQFSLISAVRSLGELIFELNRLDLCSLLLIDEQFSWKQLWQQYDLSQLQHPVFHNISLLMDNLGKIKKCTQPIEQRKIQSFQQNNEYKQQINQEIPLKTIDVSVAHGRKRKIMLNRVFLGNQMSTQTSKKKQTDQTQNTTNTFDDIFNQNSNGKKSTIKAIGKALSPIKEDMCVICWSNTSNGNLWRSSKCGHIACLDCWSKWLETKLECPMCRERVRMKFLEKFNPT